MKPALVAKKQPAPVAFGTVQFGTGVAESYADEQPHHSE
jgi:hypothetical protein